MADVGIAKSSWSLSKLRLRSMKSSRTVFQYNGLFYFLFAIV